MVSARKEPLSTRTNLTPLSFVKLAKECTCPEAMFGDKPDEFKKAYRFLAKQLHEDLFTDASSAGERASPCWLVAGVATIAIFGSVLMAT